MKLRGTGAVPRKRKRVALSSALAVFLTFTLAFSSFAWGAANDVSSTVFANDAISDIPAEDTQDSVVPGGENKTNETIEVGALSQESPAEGLDESAGNADGEASRKNPAIRSQMAALVLLQRTKILNLLRLW